MIGLLTLTALVASFALAIFARGGRRDMPLVIVAPTGTVVTVNDQRPRDLPSQPNTPGGLSSYYFFVDEGEQAVRFREPGKPERVQVLDIPATRLPIIYTLLKDSLREMRSRER
jgi:hypothetical protein